MPIFAGAMDTPFTRWDERQWIGEIRQELYQSIVAEADVVEGIPVTIFNVPKTLISVRQEAYIPQDVSIGPYHHRRPELYEMERYKVSSAKNIQKQLHGLTFEDIVERFTKLDRKIRASYHTYLDLDRDTLALLSTIDAAFLLEFLQSYVENEGPTLTRISSQMLHLVDCNRRKSVGRGILKDIIMLENQIPLFLIIELLDSYIPENSNEVLVNMFMGLYKELSPIKKFAKFPQNKEEFLKRAHLLEFLYYVLNPTLRGRSVSIQIEACEEESGAAKGENDPGYCGKSYNLLLNVVSAPTRLLKRFLSSKKFKILVALPAQIANRIRGTDPAENKFGNLLTSVEEVAIEAQAIGPNNPAQTPLVEEIMIPSVTVLSSIGIRFYPAEGGLETIRFDKASGIFYLPIIDLDDTSEVVLRNLVAYEASVAPDATVFTRYTELMNGIIDSERDVKLLREAGILLNHLKSDEEAAALWNGMSKSVKTTKVRDLDKIIEDINAYYSAKWSVKTKAFMKKYVFGSWPLLTFIAANLLLLMTALETFCSLYNCHSRWLSTT